MWSAVAPDDVKNAAPSARSKHSATLVGEYVYLLGGRNGNMPTRDFWRYNLVTGKWQQLKPMGDKLPCLQEHTAVSHKDCIYVFGGEVGFSAGSETPLWVYNIKANSWKKKRTKKGVATPKGRRGHTALVHSGTMLIYGGYQDLRGSTSELWAYHFETESWHLVSAYPSKGASDQQQQPPPRHKHSAVLHGDAMWVYGGMTDLQERSDLWKWDIASTTWLCIKSKINPGPLHSHAACKMPSCMLIFGGERNGQTCNDLWRFSFGMETWEKIIITGVKPQPRAESTAFAVSELLNCSLTTSLEYRAAKVRSRVCNSADRGHRHSSSFTHNKIAPCEKTYVFQPSQTNYNDGSELAQQFAESDRPSRSFLQEISKLSQLNLPRVSNKCSYTVLTGSAGDSTESLLRQHASPQTEIEAIDTDIATPSRGTMVKSKSAFVIKKKYHLDVSPTQDGEPKETRKRVGFDNSAFKLPREPISVPNFSTLTLPTPVLTPVEAAKLVYLDSDEENDILQERETEKEPENIMEGKEETVFQNFRPMRRGDSYTSHLGYADNPLYQQMINSLQEKSEENVSSTSDYYSIETVNRLSSASSYSVKTGTPQEENQKNREKDKTGPFGFCNPNYMGSDIKSVANETTDKKNAVRFLANEEIARNSDEEDILELQTFSGTIGKDTKVVYRHTSRVNGPPRSLALEKHQTNARQTIERYRALSAGRADRKVEHAKAEPAGQPGSDPYLPVYIYVIGGKEQGQVTVFQRPISIWKLKMV